MISLERGSNLLPECDEEVLRDTMVLMPIGGKATRAREVTNDIIPKHLIELSSGRPVLEFVLHGLQKAGFRHFIFCLGEHKDQIARYICEEKWVHDRLVSYDFSIEEGLLGVDGAVMRAIKTLKLDGQGIIVPGDMLLPWDGLANMN